VKKLFHHIWPQINKYKWSFYLTFVFYAIRIFFGSVLNVYFFKKIIDVMSNPSFSREVLAAQLIYLVILNILIMVGGNIFSRLGAWSIVYFQSNMMRELSDYSFRQIIKNSYGFFSNNFSGSLVTKSRRFVRAFEVMHDTLIFNFWGTFIVLTGVFMVLFTQAPFIASIFLSWVFVYIIIVSFFIKKRMSYDIAKAAADSRVGGRLADVFSNVFALKVFSAGEKEKVSFGEVTRNEEEHRNNSWYFGNKQDTLQAGLMTIIQAFVLYLIIKLWIAGSMNTGTVVLIQTYMIMIFERLWDLGKATTKFMESAADMKEVIDIFEIVPDIKDPEVPEPLRMKTGNIEFKDVSFVYASGQHVFNNFNLKIKPGERVGIVGHSGAGKTTVTKLLLRFIDVSSGVIEIDGQDVRTVLQDDLRRVISYVPQEPILFHRSIRENIAYGEPDATIEQIIEAAQKAHADEFIKNFKYGYDTLVGERGVKLSGGERQRIIIARAMLKNSPVLVLDEATSSLDSISESYIQNAFSELMKGKTTIVIAHRLSTVQKMDRIIVLDEGVIVEDGTHKELLEKGGVYANLWNHQTGGFLN
jgi:ABC-type multidrug transport system fused ATPase/permease subunit